MKREYKKKVAKKVFLIRESRFSPERSLSYDEAMALVRSLRRVGRYVEGQFCLEQICQQIKTVPEPHLYLLNIYLDSMQLDKAKTIVDAVYRKFPRDNRVMTNSARYFKMANDLPAALAILDRAIALFPANDQNFVMRGEMLAAAGKQQQAVESFNSALERNPGNVGALAGKTKLQKSSAGPELIEHITRLLLRRGLAERDQVILHHLLANLFEASDADRQFQHLNEANRLMSLSRPWDAREHAQLFDNIIKTSTRETLARFADASSEKLSPVMIAALPRSGTTMLEQMLGAHSKLAGIGESSAFKTARDNAEAQGYIIPGTSIERTRRAVEEVSRRFQDNALVKRAGGARLVDKSIENLMEIGNILMVFPRAKIIDLQRHPLDIIYSCYRVPFEAGHNYAFDLENLAKVYRLYRRIMDHWREVLPDKIISVSYETLVKQPELVLRQILKFCDLKWEAGCLDFQGNAGMVITASAEQVRRPLYESSVYNWEGVAEYLAPAAEILGDLVNYQPISPD